jgi:hypothetical protein
MMQQSPSIGLIRVEGRTADRAEESLGWTSDLGWRYMLRNRELDKADG